MLTAEEKQELLRIARESIVRGFQGSSPSAEPTPNEACTRQGGDLFRPGGAFVTLHLEKKLRGCIGQVESSDPVWRVVREVAPRAAFHDPRFPPLRREDVAETVIEISLLSPLTESKNIEEIEVGVHGLLLELGSQRGLLLPQVATSQGWSREEFLENTAWKAGLKPQAWKDPRARLYVFSAEIIEESHVTA